MRELEIQWQSLKARLPAALAERWARLEQRAAALGSALIGSQGGKVRLMGQFWGAVLRMCTGALGAPGAGSQNHHLFRYLQQ